MAPRTRFTVLIMATALIAGFVFGLERVIELALASGLGLGALCIALCVYESPRRESSP